MIETLYYDCAVVSTLATPRSSARYLERAVSTPNLQDRNRVTLTYVLRNLEIRTMAVSLLPHDASHDIFSMAHRPATAFT